MKYPKKTLVIIPLFMVATFIGFGLSKAITIGAQQDPKQAKVEELQQKYLDANAEAMKNGEFTTDRHGDKVFTGKTAEDMKSLEKETYDQILELKARPAEDRAKTIASVNDWNDKFLYKIDGQPKQNLTYTGRTGNVQGYPTISTETYNSEDYTYTVDYQTGKVLDMVVRAKETGETPWRLDMTPRYTAAQLEQMAVDLINAQKLGVDLSTLKLEKNQKVGTYFFDWYGKDVGGETTHLQVAFTQGGQLIGYTNVGFYEGL